MSKQLTGVVVSTKMDKTAVVEVVRKTAHPKYKKTIRKTKKYHAHDEENECREGYLVTVEPLGRRLSKTKTFTIGKILARNDILPVVEEDLIEEDLEDVTNSEE